MKRKHETSPCAVDSDGVLTSDDSTNGSSKHTKLKHSAKAMIQMKHRSLSFLDLPAEVRNLIYALYFGKICMIIEKSSRARIVASRHNKNMFSGWHNPRSYSKDHWIEVTVWPIYAVCVRVSAEARDFFYTTATFKFYEPTHLTEAFGDAKIQGIPSPAAALPRSEESAFDHIQNVWIDHVFPKVYALCCEERIRHTRRATIQAQMELLSSHLPSLRRCYVTVGAHIEEFTRKDYSPLLAPWYVHCLRNLKNLVEFQIGQIPSASRGTSIRLRAQFTKTCEAFGHIMAGHFRSSPEDPTTLKSRLDHDGCCGKELEIRITQLMIAYFEGKRDIDMLSVLKEELRSIKAESEPVDNHYRLEDGVCG